MIDVQAWNEFKVLALYQFEIKAYLITTNKWVIEPCEQNVNGTNCPTCTWNPNCSSSCKVFGVSKVYIMFICCL